MKKDLLIKYIVGNATPDEEKNVLDWIGKHPDNKKYYMDLKNLWVAQTMPQTKASVEELAAIRHLTGSVFEAKYKRRGIIMYICGSVAAAAVIALSFIIFSEERSIKMEDIENFVRIQLADIPKEYRHEVYTEKGVKARVVLPDSSQVWLNSESRIVYPDKFMGNTREIEFAGEAFFDVKKDSAAPLMIRTNKDFTVKVTGTSFNLKSYEDDNEAVATLYSGIIDIIGTGGKKEKIITRMYPNQMCVLKDDKKPVLARVGAETARKEYAWKDGKMIFDGTRMADVVKMLRRWHGVDIVVEDPVILDYKITADFESESIVQIAEMLRYCALIDFKVSDNKVYFKKREK